MSQFIEKIRNIKIRLSDLIIWFVGAAFLLCLLSVLVNFVVFQQPLVEAMINGGNSLFWLVAVVLIPASIGLMLLSKFIANKEDEGMIARGEIISWGRLVSEHIKNSDHPEHFEKVFIPLINEILDSFKSGLPDFGKLNVSAAQILELVKKDKNFEQTWMGEELLRLVFLVRKFLDLSRRVN